MNFKQPGGTHGGQLGAKTEVRNRYAGFSLHLKFLNNEGLIQLCSVLTLAVCYTTVKDYQSCNNVEMAGVSGINNQTTTEFKQPQ